MLKAKGKEDRLLAIYLDLITVCFLLYFRLESSNAHSLLSPIYSIEPSSLYQRHLPT
jgi:hypothetical protein